LRPVWGNSSQDPISKNNQRKIDWRYSPEFKPQSCPPKKNFQQKFTKPGFVLALGWIIYVQSTVDTVKSSLTDEEIMLVNLHY
jgi:hypothetical protein